MAAASSAAATVVAEVPAGESPPTVTWTRRHLLGLEELSSDEIVLLLDTAESFKEVLSRDVKKVPSLRGKTIANLFFEPSTRTRTSFELAAKRLSADSINFQAAGSSVQKGESLVDTARNIEAMQADTVVVRHSSSGAAELLARELSCSVVNAGDGVHEHPTQGLLDIFTIREHRDLAGLHVCLVGDILHSRVARSNIWGLIKLGARVTVCGPPTLIPPGIEELGASVTYDLDEVLPSVDVLNILRIQFERQHGAYFPSIREYAVEYGISVERLARAPSEVLILHPQPMHRGIEIAAEVADGEHSVILEQVTNGVAVRMAVLLHTTLAAAPR
jgi:aspartate carbamoyltransferase catalytic subunit